MPLDSAGLTTDFLAVDSDRRCLQCGGGKERNGTTLESWLKANPPLINAKHKDAFRVLNLSGRLCMTVQNASKLHKSTNMDSCCMCVYFCY